MDKMQMAHDFAMKLVGNPNTPLKTMGSIVDASWEYADTMQAEVDKRNKTERPKSLCEVDWIQAPSNAIGWMFFDGVSTWLGEDGFLIEDAPLFGFTEPHIVERPHGI